MASSANRGESRNQVRVIAVPKRGQIHWSSEADGSASVSSSASAPILQDCPASHDENFGQININISIDDFNALGFEYGDEVDIAFSNGYQITVPYFSGYYGEVGARMLVAYPGNQYVLLAENFGNSMWEIAGLADGDMSRRTFLRLIDGIGHPSR